MSRFSNPFDLAAAEYLAERSGAAALVSRPLHYGRCCDEPELPAPIVDRDPGDEHVDAGEAFHGIDRGVASEQLAGVTLAAEPGCFTCVLAARLGRRCLEHGGEQLELNLPRPLSGRKAKR